MTLVMELVSCFLFHEKTELIVGVPWCLSVQGEVAILSVTAPGETPGFVELLRHGPVG